MNATFRRESVRTAVLHWLHDRLSVAFEAKVICERVNKSGLLDFEAEQPEIDDALTFLKGADLVKAVPHALGATLFFQVTSAGVLAHERGTLAPRPL